MMVDNAGIRAPWPRKTIWVRWIACPGPRHEAAAWGSAASGRTASPASRVLRLLTRMTVVGMLLWPGTGGAGGSTACDGDGLEVVVVSTSGVPRRASCEELVSDRPPADMDHGWRWSTREAPRRVLPDGWPGSQRSPAAVDSLILELHELPRDAEGVSVIAGPTEMWQSVFEDLMPRWRIEPGQTASIPRSSKEPWRLRVVSAEVASEWVDVAPAKSGVVVRVRPSKTLELTAVAADGSPVERVVARAFSAGAFRVGNRRQPVALFFGDRGRVVVRSIPVEEPVRLLVQSAELAPQMVEGVWDEIPSQLQLVPGAWVTGTVVDGDSGEPVEGAVISVDFWAQPTLAWAMSSRVVADAAGVWDASGLPAGEVVVEVRAAGYGAMSRRLVLQEGERVNLGALALHPAAELTVKVRDDLGRAVRGAVVRVGNEPAFATDDTGTVLLTGVPLTGAEVQVSAKSHLPSAASAHAPLPKVLQVQLVRAYRVSAQLVEADGRPVSGGRARIETGTSTAFKELDQEGRLTADLLPDAEYHLVLEGPTTPSVRLEIPPGAPGEMRDLGVIAAPPGHVVAGTVICGETGEPVAAARVWTLRPSPRGPVVAWMQKDLIETAADGEGYFALGGLPRGLVTLRVEAPGHARAHVEVDLGEGDEGLNDLGPVRLSRGWELEVEVSSRDPEGMVAKLDLRGEGLPADLLQAPMRGGLAAFPRVEPGTYDLVVQRGQKQICSRSVTVGDSDESVRCDGADVHVLGSVVVGDKGRGAGTTVWRSRESSNDGLPGGIMTVTAPSGLRQQSSFSTTRMDIVVPVTHDGRFDTFDVSSGAWRVAWYPESGASGGAVDVEVPEVEEFETALRFSAIEIAGSVVDEDRRPYPEARVRELVSGNMAIADANGEFRLSGLAPGTSRLQASHGSATSEVLAIEVEENRRVDRPTLVIREDSESTLRVEVLDERGRPAPSAFVFLHTGTGADQIALSSSLGVVEFHLPDPVPRQVRAAAFANGSWILGGLHDTDRRDRTLRLTGQPAGSVVVVSTAASGSPTVVSTDGWDLSWLLTRLGMRPLVGPDRDLRLSGVPEGTYTVALRDAREVASVRSGREVVVKLE